MKCQRVKFKRTLFRKKVNVYDMSTEDYDNIVDIVDFDPLYFVDNKNEPRSLERLFCLTLIRDGHVLRYENKKQNMFFVISLKNVEEVSYKELKEMKSAFIIERGGKFYILEFLYEI